MLINENNIKEALRVVGLFEDEVLKSLGENGSYIKTGEMYATRKLQACAEVLVCLETNDRMAGNKPTAGQMGFALSLAKQNTDKAKMVLKDMGKPTIDKLDATEISAFIDRMKERG